MPMIIGKQERTLAIDGPYIHVSYALRPSLLRSPRLLRLCRRRTKPLKRFLTTARRHPITSTASSRANPAKHPRPRSASWSIAALGTALTSGMSSRRKTPNSPVRVLSLFKEACSRLLDEIVQTIKALKSALERTGSITNKARRIKHLP